MASNSPQKPTFPPLKCEQLEDRLVLTVHVVPAGTQPTESVQSHPNVTAATNFVLHPMNLATAPGTVSAGAMQGGSEVSATSAATGTSAGAGTSATAGGTGTAAVATGPAGASYSSAAAQSASGAVAGGGPLFASGSVPSIIFSASNPSVTPASTSSGFRAPSGGPSQVAGSTSSSSSSVAPQSNEIVPALPNTVTTDTLAVTPISEPALTSQSHPQDPGTTLTEFLAPTNAPTQIATASSSSTQVSEDKTAALPASPMPPLTTTITSTTTSDVKDTTIVVVHGNATQPADDQLLNPDTDVPQE